MVESGTTVNFIVCNPPTPTPSPLHPFLSAGGGGQASYQIFKRDRGGGGRLTAGSQFLEGGCWERGGDFF